MSLEEFNGWIVYLNIQAEELENKKCSKIKDLIDKL